MCRPARVRGKTRRMTIIRINAITVPEGGGAELERRFAARSGDVDQRPGFEGFELLRPTDDRTTWLVVSRWRDEETFNAWLQSPAFAHGHRGVSGSGEAHGGGHPGGGHGGGERPMAMNAELWSYEIATAAEPKQG